MSCGEGLWGHDLLSMTAMEPWVMCCSVQVMYFPFLDNYLNSQLLCKDMDSFSWNKTSFNLNPLWLIGRIATKDHAGCVLCNSKQCLLTYSLWRKWQSLVLCSIQPAQLYLEVVPILILHLSTMKTTSTVNCHHLFWNFIPSIKVKLFLCLIKFLLFKIKFSPWMTQI